VSRSSTERWVIFFVLLFLSILSFNSSNTIFFSVTLLWLLVLWMSSARWLGDLLRSLLQLMSTELMEYCVTRPLIGRDPDGSCACEGVEASEFAPGAYSGRKGFVVMEPTLPNELALFFLPYKVG
jgi:hypothetical protein